MESLAGVSRRLRRLWGYVPLGFAFLVVSWSCGGDSTTEPGAGRPASLIILSGQDQSGSPGQELPQVLQVKVVDSLGNAVPGQIVNFKVVSGGGSVFAGAAITTDSGIAKERWTLGTSTADSQRVEARAVDPASGVGLVFGVFRATVAAGAASKLVITTSPSSSIPNRVVFTSQPVIQAQDANNNPVSGVSVTASITSGGGTLGGTTTVTTASNGLATFTNLFIAGTVGARTLTFSATGLTSATANVTLTTGSAATIAVNSGNNQTGAVGAFTPGPVSVKVTDADGNTVSGVTVTFAVASGGGTISPSDATQTTNSSGVASTSGWSLGSTAGTNTLTASASGLSGSPLTLTATGTTFQVQRIVAGGNHACALTSAGAAYCWGLNDFGQLGDGTTFNRDTPVAVSGSLVFQSLVSGASHNCGITNSGATYCWGANNGGQLGDGTTTNRLTPTLVTGGNVFQSLAGGGYHTCGVKADNSAYCWGRNNWGQLGDGSTTFATSNSLVPQLVIGGHAFQSLTAGGWHTCGVTTTGAAYCWGHGSVGELGDGQDDPSSTPVLVAGGHTFQSLVAGDYPDLAGNHHTCGLTTAGVAYCWGAGSAGELGDGTTNRRSTPWPVAGGHTFQSLAAGGHHTCGVRTDGTAYCWGAYTGDGTTTTHLNPVAVNGGFTFQRLTTGASTCGITSGGAAYCWGRNIYGQLGDGTSTDRLSPAAVRTP